MENSGVGFSELLRVTFTLGLIVALIFGLSVVLRRVQGDRRLTPAVFKVLAAMSLGTREKIYLLQVGNEQLVIGKSAAGITTLHKMQENVVIEAGIEQHASGYKFAEILRSLGKGGN